MPSTVMAAGDNDNGGHDNDAEAKAALYRRIVRDTPAGLLLQRMQLYGFWPPGQALPPDPPEETAERAALAAQIEELRQRYRELKNPQQVLAEERRRRWQASKQRRAEAKARRAAEAARRREAWQERKRASVVYAGDGVSAGLADTRSDRAALAARGLPSLDDGADLAAALEIDLSTLRWLSYHRRGAVLVHYHRYDIAKKTGGRRLISAPKPLLARAQRWVLHEILSRLPPEPAAHGFVPGRSILSNAAPHVDKAVLVNLDLQDFFPSITFARVKGVFARLGYSEQVATLLALLCTEPPRVEALLDGHRYYVALGERALPQGACTSPALSNRLCRRLDRRLGGLAASLGFAYSRYADDLSFSGGYPERTGRLLACVRRVIAAEGFVENPGKTRVMRRGRRQQVTGLTVNQGLRVGRRERRELRAILHNAARHGLASQNRDGRRDFAAYLRGRVAFVCMVEPRRAAHWRALLDRALADTRG